MKVAVPTQKGVTDGLESLTCDAPGTDVTNAYRVARSM